MNEGDGGLGETKRAGGLVGAVAAIAVVGAGVAYRVMLNAPPAEAASAEVGSSGFVFELAGGVTVWAGAADSGCE